VEAAVSWLLLAGCMAVIIGGGTAVAALVLWWAGWFRD
jgi:hypothetical protein